MMGTDHEIIPRAEWGAKPPTAPLSPMTQPDGWVVHYVGGPCTQDPTLAQSKALVYNLQEEAFDGGNGETYIDIPYNFLVDNAGRIFEGRGFANKSGANGSANYNGHAWAVCWLGGPTNTFTQEAHDAIGWLTREGARRAAAVSYVKGHRDVYPTACPGDQVYSHVGEWQAHLHDHEPSTAVDLHAIAELLAWQKRVSERPLLEDSDPKDPARPLDTQTLRALLKARGYDVTLGLVYGPRVVAAVHQFKIDHHLPNQDGTTFGAYAAAAILGTTPLRVKTN